MLKKLMKGETSKVQFHRFKVWTQTTSAFFQRKAVEESEIWSNIYGHLSSTGEKNLDFMGTHFFE